MELYDMKATAKVRDFQNIDDQRAGGEKILHEFPSVTITFWHLASKKATQTT